MCAQANAELPLALRSQMSRGVPQRSPYTSVATGQLELDEVLGGGIPCGAITEICGVGSAGRMTLALAVMAEQSRAGARVAWVDGADRLDISSVDSSGVDLDRFLWVRAYERRGLKRALCATELLLDSSDFSVVTLDMVGLRRGRGAVKSAWWVRLGRKAARTKTALLVLGDGGEVFGAGLKLECAFMLDGVCALLKVDFKWRQGGAGQVGRALLVMPPVR